MKGENTLEEVGKILFEELHVHPIFDQLSCEHDKMFSEMADSYFC